MRCEIQLLDSEDKPWFVGERDLPSEYMLKLAADRLPMLREKGAEFAQGAIPVFGAELVKVVKAGSSEDDIDKAVIQLALAAVTVESFLGVNDAVLLKRNFSFAVYENGAVKIDHTDI